MKIIGIDFTSSPCRKKPITCAIGKMVDNELHIKSVNNLIDFSEFEDQLTSSGPWVAGLDFPFGQSRKLISNLNWPETWEGYVSEVATLSRDEFVALLESYKADRQPGDKEHRREIDRLASSISPQKLYGVPVAKMFYEGAVRILKSNADIVPVHRLNSSRVIVEAYPAIVARRFIGKRSYKNDQKKKQTIALEHARHDIVAGLFSDEFKEIYGLTLKLGEGLEKQLVEDASGDTLDSVLCAIQAGWAYLSRDNGYGIPEYANPCEGWIADPKFLRV